MEVGNKIKAKPESNSHYLITCERRKFMGIILEIINEDYIEIEGIGEFKSSETFVVMKRYFYVVDSSQTHSLSNTLIQREYTKDL